MTSAAPRSPAAEEPKEASAEPSIETAAPVPPAEAAAEAASAEPAQPPPAEAVAAQPERSEAGAAQPGPADAASAQPALDAPVMPEAAPASTAVPSEAAPKMEEAPPAVLDPVAEKKIDPAEPTSVSAPPSEPQGVLHDAMHCKSPCMHLDEHGCFSLPTHWQLSILARYVRIAPLQMTIATHPQHELTVSWRISMVSCRHLSG